MKCTLFIFECLYLQQLVSSAREKKVGRYARLEDEMERNNQDFIDQQRHQQQVRRESEGGRDRVRVGEIERGGKEEGREEERKRDREIVCQLCMLTVQLLFPRVFDASHFLCLDTTAN